MPNLGPPCWLFDFRDPAAAETWRAIDDRVMGGVSRSRLRHDPAGHAVFEGEVRCERGGGFASVRSPVVHPGLAGASACLLEVRGPGRRFLLNLRDDVAFDGVHHQAGFSPAAVWQTLSLPLSAFCPGFRGRPRPEVGPFDPARLRQIGLMIAGGQAGPFALEIRRLGLA